MSFHNSIYQRFKNLSIRSKLTAIMTMLSGVTLLLATLVFSAVEYLQERNALTNNISIQMEMIAFNSRAALAFDAPETASMTLQALKANQAIHLAALFKLDGTLFAAYKDPEQSDPMVSFFLSHHYAATFEADELVLQQPIMLDGEQIGSILIHANLEALDEQLAKNGVLIVSVLVFSLVLAFFLASRLQNLITTPIESLRRSSIEIGKGHFNTTIEIHSHDEIGQLAQTFQQMVTDLARQRSALEQATRAKSEFLANMSHEIRTPMNAIIGLTDLALQTPMSELAQDYLTKIVSSSRSLLSILNDILDFSKIDAGKLVLESVPFRLGEVFEQLENLFHAQVVAKNIELIISTEESSRELLGDALRLEQILMNLVSNAIKFIDKPAGKVELRVRTLSETQEQVVLEFAVQDTGVGLSGEQIDFLFTAFTQADSSTTRKFGGTGLGLVICKRLVAMMQGKIWVVSKPQHGSTFYFTATFAPHTAKSEVIHEAKRDPLLDRDTVMARIKGARILLVEDNAINRLVAKEILQALSLVVDMAVNGCEAVEKIAQETYDLVLMDLQMPEMDGYTATRQIRQNPHFTALPIIAMTAHTLSGDREKCLEAGMNDHLAKPIDKQRLFAALIHWIVPREGIGATVMQKAMPLPVDVSTGIPVVAGIDMSSALERLNGNWSLLRSILLEFSTHYADAAQQVKQALTDRRREEMESVVKLLHSIKGVAGNISAVALFTDARDLEASIKNNARSSWPGLLNRFENSLRELVNAVAVLPEEEVLPHESVEPVDPERLKPMMHALAASIADNAFDALEQLESIKPFLQGDFNESYQRIKNALDRFDFNEASKEMASLVKALKDF
ncbi:MAG: response regulator [Magnetococcales bacterium]|nr:response regulator [Magnetococcales bacterium]